VVEYRTAKWRVCGSGPGGYFINVLISFYAVYAFHIAFKVGINGRKLVFCRTKERKCFPEIALKVNERFKESEFRPFP
jgi:hypothetical protein